MATIDASIGTTTANSYVTTEEMDAYFLERVNSTKYVATLDKDAAAISASRLLDWQLKFDGYKASSSQSMQFPRSEIYLSDGTLVPNNIIPMEVKYATFELIYLSIGTDRLADNSLAGIDQVKAGPLFVKATPGGYGSTKAEIIPEFIRKILLDFTISSSIGVVRLMRG